MSYPEPKMLGRWYVQRGRVKFGAWLATAGLLLGVSCGGDADDESDDLTHEGDVTYCHIEPIVQEKCLRCHSDPPENGAPFSLTSFDAIEDEVVLVRRAVSSGFMPATGIELEPPVEDLTEEERDLIIEWIDAGAPSGACD